MRVHNSSTRLHHRLACIAILCCGALVPTLARAQDWTITTADLRSFTAAPIQIDAATLTLGPGSSGPATVPVTQFVSATRIAASTPQPGAFILIFRDGQRLSGRPQAVLEDKLAWNSDLLGVIDFPLVRLRGMTRPAAASAPLGRPPRQDIVSLQNGDSVSGVFTGCSAISLTLQGDSGPVEVPLSGVKSILFASTSGPAPAPAHKAPSFQIGFLDGSMLDVADVTLSGERLGFSYAGQPRLVLLGAVRRIEQINGPIAWLSSLEPIEQVSVPYFGAPALPWPARFDSAVDGAPIIVAAQRFDRGIGVHAYSRLTFALDAGWSEFRTQYAVDRGPQQNYRLADLTVRILLDGNAVYQRQHVRDGGLSDIISVPLGSAHRLTLECDYGSAGDVQGRLNWIQPALLRNISTTQP